MNLSRKEFFTHGLATFGQELMVAVTGGERVADSGSVACSGRLLVDNDRCLAQRGGCFACLDRCPREALSISAGIGITVAEDLCDGCGACVQVCPVQPRALRLNDSTAGSISGGKGAEHE